MVAPEKLNAMQTQWVRLLAGFGVGPPDAYPPFDRLVEAYAEPHRHYHTLEHLGEMFRVAGRLASEASDIAAVQLAIWYHDAVYDPTATDNEERSAELAERELAALGLPAATVERVANLVRATGHTDEPADGDARVLLDADLAILGAAEPRYLRYAADIRKEYTHVPDADYRRGRGAVLEAFLARPRIYRTPAMLELGEAAARRNLAAEIASLRTNSEPPA